jgi:hypothetical protein
VKEIRSMTLLTWARPRRWSILGEAVLAVLVALVAWPILAVGAREPAPVQVVTAYLEALRDGDVVRAETFASNGFDSTADLSWLTPEAMSSDWEIESVELKSASETTVHAVISSGGTRAEGAFLLENVDDDFLITNPYMYLSISGPLFTSMEIGGVSGEIASVGDSSPASVALYPGSYTLFESVPELAGGDGLSLLAMPGSAGAETYSTDTIDFDRLMTNALADSEAIETRLNDELAAWLDECAESSEVAPPGCPFNAAESMSIAYDGRTEFSDVSELDWAVGAYPKVRFGRDLRLEVVEPGWMALSGTGTPWYDGGETALDGHCAIALLDVAPSFGEGGELTLTLTAETSNTCA